MATIMLAKTKPTDSLLGSFPCVHTCHGQSGREIQQSTAVRHTML